MWPDAQTSVAPWLRTDGSSLCSSPSGLGPMRGTQRAMLRDFPKRTWESGMGPCLLLPKGPTKNEHPRACVLNFWRDSHQDSLNILDLQWTRFCRTACFLRREKEAVIVFFKIQHYILWFYPSAKVALKSQYERFQTGMFLWLPFKPT